MQKQTIIKLICLSLFTAVIIVPAIVHGYIYPTMGDDSALHLSRLKGMSDNADNFGLSGVPLISQMYFAYTLIGYPLNWISSGLGISINNLFLWFNFASLVAVGYAFYFVLSRLINYKAGLFALVVPFFVSKGLLWEYDYGMIFNIINIGVILPFLVYFAIRYLTEKKFYQLGVTLVLAVLFSTFHTSGIYLLPVAGLILVAYLFNELFRKKRKLQPRVIMLSLLLIIVSLVCIFKITPITGAKGQSTLSDIASGNYGITVSVSYILGIISPVAGMMLVFAGFFLSKDKLKELSNKGKALILVLIGFVLVLAVPVFTGLSYSPDRQVFDLSIIFSLVVAIFAGLVSINVKLVGALVLIACIGLYFNLPSWINYRSAVKDADKQAISYLNTLNNPTFITSPEVAHRVYEQFIPERYNKASDLLITRSSYMTPCSDVKSKAYDGHGLNSTEGFTLDRSFNDGMIEVKVYRK